MRQKYICVSHNSGEASAKEPSQYLAELAEICDKHNIHRVLLDERNITCTIGNIFGLMSLGDKLLQKLLVLRFHRLACATKPEQLKTAQDFEAVARNRGMNYRAFETIEAAEVWLNAN